MEENKRDPMEDISLIRQMLERSTGEVKTAAPWLMGFGLIWIIYGVFSVLQRLGMLWAPLPEAKPLSLAGALLKLLFYFVLAVFWWICRSKLAQQGKDSPALKLADMWGVCIFLFLILNTLLNPVIGIVAVRFLGYSADAAGMLNVSCLFCRNVLFFLLPIAPLLITAVFLDNRRMLLSGAILAVLAATVIFCQAFILFGDGMAMGVAWQYFCFGAACLLDLATGVMLLAFARRMKGR